MDQRKIFGLVIRIAGLAGLYYVVNHWFHMYHKTGSVHFSEPWKLLCEILLIPIGLYMIRGAPLFLNFMCPKDDGDENGQDRPN
jgi:hypothetical protein